MDRETLLNNLRGWLKSFRESDASWESIASLSDDELLSAFSSGHQESRRAAYARLFRLHRLERERRALQDYSQMF
jgi:hypothetical protein